MPESDTPKNVNTTKSTTKQTKPRSVKKAPKTAKKTSKTAKKTSKSDILASTGEKERKSPPAASKVVDKRKLYDPNQPQDLGNDVMFRHYGSKAQNFDKEKFEQYCAEQQTQRYICAKFNMTSSTLHKYIMKTYGYGWCHVHSVLRSRGMGAVKEALYNKAVGGDMVAIKLYTERFGHTDNEADPALRRLGNIPASGVQVGGTIGQDASGKPEFNISIGVMPADDSNIYDVEPDE